MTYKLAFNESALKEWKKLGHTIQEQFKKKLRERLENPRVPASQLHGRKDQYKIKLRGAGYRLVYSVEDEMYRFYFIHPCPSSCMINMQSPNISN